jgi:[ribosomal protein S5]-alanine N-acetyltransferase
MEIFFEGILLRPWCETDARRLTEIADNRNIADNLRDGFPNPYYLKDAIEWLGVILPENDPVRFFAIEVDGILSGSIGLVAKSDIYRKNIEIGYFLDQKLWGRGIITSAIKAATSYAFKSFDVVRVYAEPFSDNNGSRRALEKSGYILEAILKKNVVKGDIIKDSCIYSVLKENFKY